MRRICVVVTARPSWAKLQTICEAIQAHPDLHLQIVACASALLERYGHVAQHIEAAGFPIAEKVYSVYEGATLETSARETGALCTALAGTFARLRPDVVLLMADRHEVLAAAQAASYQHICVAHCQGGERSGSIDDKVRDAITALADVHFPCTAFAALRVYGLTGSSRVHRVGCSSIDLARRALEAPAVTGDELGGAGAPVVDLSQPFGLVLQHPVTSEADQAGAQMARTLRAMGSADWNLQTIAFWPGEDAGADAASKVLRGGQDWLHTVRSLPPLRFLRLLADAAVIVGNSSASVREAAYLGTPAVVIGARQWGREHAAQAVFVPHEHDAMASAIQAQVAHGRYPSSALYGTGDSGPQIAEVLATWDR